MIPVNLSLDFGHQNNHSQQQIINTGLPALDSILPQGGWPVGAITEIFCSDNIALALPVIWPALTKLNQAQRWLALIAPPHNQAIQQIRSMGVDLSHVLLIHPHATSDGLWAVEQALRTGTCAAVLSWVNSADHHAMQDLRGAALAGNSCGLIFRPDWAQHQPSAANLRLKLTASDKGLYIERLNLRTSRPETAIYLETEHIKNIA